MMQTDAQAPLAEQEPAVSGDALKPAVSIIGFGAAGVNAAIALRNAGYQDTIRVFSDTETPPYSPIMTSYFAGGQKSYEECFPWSEDELRELDLEVVSGSPVIGLDVENHSINTQLGSFNYTKCLIATGARAATFGFPQTDACTPLVLRTLDDAHRFKAALEDPSCKRILISGASMVAIKMLETCLDQGLDCSLVGMNPHILDFNAVPETAVRFEEGLRKAGVKMRFGQTIQVVEPAPDAAAQGGKLKVTFSSGEVDYFDQVAVAHGVLSNLDFLSQGALEMDRALLVDEYMRTSDPDVYAAGDVAQALELVSGEQRIVGIWKTAALQGACAGYAMAAELAGGEPSLQHAYKGAIPTNTISIAGTLFISAGSIDMSEGRTLEIRENEDMTVAYIYEKAPDVPKRLVGFNVACGHDEAGSAAYDIGAMLTLRIESGCARA